MHAALAPILAFDKGLIGQLVFVLIALLAWILREAAERRAARQAGPTPEGERVDAMLRARREEHPEAYVDMDAGPVPPPVPAAEPVPGAIGDLQPTFVPKDLGTMEAHPDMQTHRRAGRAPVRRRLGIAPGGGRRAVRRAVLWSELLGPPRALTGPHRAPIRRR